jgi:hypothetical protein
MGGPSGLVSAQVGAALLWQMPEGLPVTNLGCACPLPFSRVFEQPGPCGSSHNSSGGRVKTTPQQPRQKMPLDHAALALIYLRWTNHEPLQEHPPPAPPFSCAS